VVPCCLIGLEGGGACFKEKAYVQKELAAGTRLKIGVPFYAEASGGLFF
jgi:hypothetical protein